MPNSFFRHLLAVLSIGMTIPFQESFSQTNPCLFDAYLIQNKQTVQLSESAIQKQLKHNSLFRISNHGIIYQIPVVVHVIHNGGNENISDAQIQSQIDVLNEDYRKAIGTNGFGNGVDTEIEFCLAKLTPDGKCTNGIVRIKSTLTNHNSYERQLLSQLSSWDPTRYLNIYVVKSIAGNVGGYASFPGGPTDQDGIVIIHNAFGRTGTAQNPNNLGRTCTHESGHWFGLYHTFNSGCGIDTCLDGDLVCDTPPVANPNFNCPAINSCSNDFPDYPDQVENYMDYTSDLCKNIFTSGQRDRMQATLNVLRQDIWQATNIINTGCDSAYISPPCNVVADFIANGTQICLNNIVTFTNKSLNDPISFQWNFPGGNPSTSIDQNPTISYDTIGNFDVSLIVYGSLGSDTLSIPNYVNVFLPVAGSSLPFDETFEQSVFPANGITIDNPDHGVTWERDTVAIMYQGYASAKINNLINTNYGQSDALILPDIDLTTFIGVPFMSFRWAYAKSDPNYSDELIILISTDCHLNFTRVFYRSGNLLATGPNQTNPYIPDSNTVWKLAQINLSQFQTFENVSIRIVNVTDGGNNLYIDSIHIGSVLQTGNEEYLMEEISIYPNPFNSELTFEFPSTIHENIELSLYDLLGRKLDQFTIIGSHGIERVVWSPKVNSDKKFLILELKTSSRIIRKTILHE